MLNCSTMFFSTWETCIWSFLYSTLNAGNLIMLQEVRLMMFWLNMADYSMSFLLLSTLFFPSFMLKSYGWGGVGWWGDVPWDLSVSPRPLEFGFRGLGFGAWAWQFVNICLFPFLSTPNQRYLIGFVDQIRAKQVLIKFVYLSKALITTSRAFVGLIGAFHYLRDKPRGLFNVGNTFALLW